MLLEIPGELIENLIVLFVDDIRMILRLRQVCKQLLLIASKDQVVARLIRREFQKFLKIEYAQFSLALHMSTNEHIIAETIRLLSLNDHMKLLSECAAVSNTGLATHYIAKLLLEKYSVSEDASPGDEILTIMVDTGQIPAEMPRNLLSDRLKHLYYYIWLPFSPRKFILLASCFRALPIINAMRPWIYFGALLSILTVESTATTTCTLLGISLVLLFMLLGGRFSDSPWDFLVFLPAVILRLVLLYQEIIKWIS